MGLWRSRSALTAFLAIGLTLISWRTGVANDASADEPPRVRTSFDFGWRFHLGDVPEAKSADFDHSDWRELDVPHDWSVEQPFSREFASGTGYLPGGIGWYRKEFDVPVEWRGREVFVEFDGVQRNSDVWINGTHLGHRPNGYISFQYRLTPHLRYGEKNVVAVRAAREQVADSRWYPGSGIYRHTWLKVTQPVHVDHWGIQVTTPRVTDSRADITVSTAVVNRTNEESSLRIESEIVDPAGNSLSNQATNASLQPGETKTFLQWHVAENPQRWSLDKPLLYSSVNRIYRDQELLDEVRTPFGIRTFYFDPDEGFFLNGESTLIKGLCMHHDAGVVGAAVPDDVLQRRLQLVKAMGANAVRCSHNPMAPELYTLCDQLGLLVMDEAFDEWELGKRKWVEGRNVGRAQRHGYNEHFEQWGVRDAEDMVLRSRNHPSIILWSLGNEIDYPGDPYEHPEFFDPDAPPVEEGSPSATRLAVVAPELVAAVKKHDPTRPVTMALSNLPTANAIGLPNMLDVVGYNYQEQFYEEDHENFPGRVIYGSENSRSLRSWRFVRDNDYISSLYLWVGFDFLGEANEWPNRGSQAGVFDTRGFMKPSGRMYHAVWSEEPMVHLFVGDSGRRREGRRRRWFRMADQPRLWSAAPEATVPVMIVSNCESVQLELNGQPIEVTSSRRGDFFRAELSYEAGTLEVRGLNAEEVVAEDSLTTPGEAQRIAFSSDQQALVADGRDVAHVEIRIVDEQGNLVPTARQTITVSVSGAGKLLGVDNGDQNDTTPLKSPTKTTRDGRLLAIVQTERTGGTIELTAEGETLTPAQLQLTAD